MMDLALVENVAKAICAERCAFYGDPPCWRIAPEEYAMKDCGDPEAGSNDVGCRVLAKAAVAAMAAP
jgi:hypothetical protein